MNLIKRLQVVKGEMQLSKKVSVKDVKEYLEDEFERAKAREEYIVELENKLKEATDLKIKYDAMLVVQEKVSERVERQDERIKALKEELKKELSEKVNLKAKITDLRINSKKAIAKKSAKERKKR